MRLQDIPEDIEPQVGDIIEIEQGDVCFEVRIIGITADGYLCEQDNIQGALLLEGVALDHDDVTDITGYIAEERVRLDPKCWKGKKIGNPKTKIKGGVRVNNCVPEGQQDVAKPITYYSLVHKATNKVLSTHKDLESAKDEHRGMDQGERAHYRIATSTKAPKSFSMKEDAEGVAEAGPFSYGYKKPRKGSVAYWAEKKRKEQEKGKPPIEPKDQMVGVAKVTKAVSEGSLNEVTQGVEHSEWADNVRDAYPGVKIVKKRTEDGRHIKSQAILNGQLVGQYNMNTGVGTFKAPKQQGVAEDISSTKKKISKYEELALAANRAGDDAKCKQYQQKIQVLKQKMSQGVAEGYTGRETKDGTWRVFKDGQAVAVAGPFKSRDEAHAWIKKHKQGVSEAKSLKKRVRVVQGEHAGKTGWIREIKHGIHSTAPKRYYVDIDGGGQADNLPAAALRLMKDQSDDKKGMAEGDHDDQFSLSGKMPATDRIPQDSTAGQDKVQAMVARMKQRTIDSILDEKPEWERSDLELMTAAELNQILRDIQSGEITEAEYQGRKVPLGKPMAGDVAKSKVYVRKPNGKVVKVNFGDKNMTIKKSNPKRRKSFRARHNCQNPGPRWKARYWSCRAW